MINKSPSIKIKFLLDVIFNMMATLFPSVLLQIVIYPLVANKIGSVEYGFMITEFSLINLVAGTIGCGIGNIRLLLNNKYEDEDLNGDFKFISVLFIPISMIMYVIINFVIAEDSGFTTIAFMSISCGLIMILNCMIVDFRIDLNFKYILYNQFVCGFGYLIGLAIFYFLGNWEWIIISPQIICVLFCYRYTKLLKEPWKRTYNFKACISKIGALQVSEFLSRITTYADKLLLLPLLGGTSVSIYYTANFFGKFVLVAMEPIANVVLSYIVKKKELHKNTIRMYLTLVSVFCIIAYLVSVTISPTIISFLYPKWANDAYSLISITTLAMCIYTACSFVYPLTLKYCSINWQMVINGSSCLAYIGFSVILLKYMGVLGFCYGVCIAYSIRLFLLLAIYIIRMRKRELVNEEL